MYIVESYHVAVIFCLITMLCWGIWAGFQKFAPPNYPFSFFYWDFIVGLSAFTVLFAFTAGSIGSAGRSFVDDVQQASIANLLYALVGGVLFNAGNSLFLRSIALTGMTVAFPVGGGLALMLGVLTNYILSPVQNPWLLVGGVVSILFAMFFSAEASRKYQTAQHKTSLKGIALAIGAGIFFGIFYPFLSAAMASDANAPEAGKLTAYTAVVSFSVGLLLSNILFSALFKQRAQASAQTSAVSYIGRRVFDHSFGLFAGMLWATGLSLNILAGEQAGYAVSFGLSQGNAMVAAAWGIVVSGEYKVASPSVRRLLTLMFVCYMLGLFLIALSR